MSDLHDAGSPQSLGLYVGDRTRIGEHPWNEADGWTFDLSAR
jgi:hypothetical protein